MEDFSLGPLIAISLSKDRASSEVGYRVLCHLAQDSNEELREQAKIKLDTIAEIKKGEEQNLKEAILKELGKLPPDIMSYIRRNQITQQEIVEHYDVFRNALWFSTRVMLGTPLATSISSSVLPLDPATSFLPAVSARYKRVRLESCRVRRKQRAKRRKAKTTNLRIQTIKKAEVQLRLENPRTFFKKWDLIGHGAESRTDL